MKKLGFTLSELIITLGIIAIVSALTLPAINNLMPDKNKPKVIEYYNRINEVNQKLLSDKILYPTVYEIDDSGKISVTSSGFNNTNKKNDDNNDVWQKDSEKYPYYFFKALDISYTQNTHTYSMPDGFELTAEHDTSNKEITVTLNLKNGNNCIFDNGQNCRKPDIFIFDINPENGSVSAGDALTKAYLMNPTEMNNKKEDLEKAAEFLPDFESSDS